MRRLDRLSGVRPKRKRGKLLASLALRPISLRSKGASEDGSRSGYTIWAFAILNDHVHFVVKRHHYKVEQVARAVKQVASTELLDRGLHPFADMRLESGFLPSVWAQDFWRVFFFNDDDIWRSIEYMERNPERSGCPRHRWKFVVPFHEL